MRVFFPPNTGRATLISSDVGQTKTGGRVIYVTWNTKQKDAFFLKRCSLLKPQQKTGRDTCAPHRKIELSNFRTNNFTFTDRFWTNSPKKRQSTHSWNGKAMTMI